MKTLLASTLALVLFGTSYQTGVSSNLLGEPTATGNPDAALLSFSRLAAGHTLLVEYETQGCFHHRKSELLFSGGSPLSVAAVDIREEWDRTSQTYATIERVPLGIQTLSPADAAGLDSLISFYRSGPGNGCTTTDTVHIRHLFKGRVVAAEGFFDGSCSYDADRPIKTFGEILYRFRKE